MTWCDNNSWWKDLLYTKKANRIPRNEIDGIEILFSNHILNLKEIDCYTKIPYLKCNNFSIINLSDDTDIKKSTEIFSCEILEGSNITINPTISLEHWETDKFCEWSIASLKHIGYNNPDKIDFIKSHYIECSTPATGTGLYLANLSSIDNSYLIAKNAYIENCTTDELCVLDLGSGIISGGDTCIIDGNLFCQDIIFSGGVIFRGTGEGRQIEFLNNATNKGLLYIDSGIFKNGGQNKGHIIGNAIFDNSINFSNISGDCIFLNSSVNFGNIYGETIFSGTAVNNGNLMKSSYFYDNSSNLGIVSGNGKFINQSKNMGLITEESFFDMQSLNSGNLSNSSIFKNNSINAGTISGGQHSFSSSNNLGNIYNSLSCNFIMTGINYGNLYNVDSIIFMSGSNNIGDILTSKSIGFSDSGINNGNISTTNKIVFIDESKNNGDISNSNCVFRNSTSNNGSISSGFYYNTSTNLGTTNLALFYNDTTNFGAVSTIGFFYERSKNFGNINNGLFFADSINMLDTNIQNAEFYNNSINYGVAKTGEFNNKSINIGIINFGILLNQSANYGTIDSAIFKNSSINSGTVLGIGWFYDSSANYTNLNNKAFFYNNSRNTADLFSEAIFYDTSKNIGRCFNNGIFRNRSENLGVLLESGLFEDFSKNTGYCSGVDTQFKNNSINAGRQIPLPIGVGSKSLLTFMNESKNESYLDMNNNDIRFYNNTTNNGSLINSDMSTSTLGLGNISFNDSSINNGTISGLNIIEFNSYNALNKSLSINNGDIIAASSIRFLFSINNGLLRNNTNIKFEEATNNGNINNYDSLEFLGGSLKRYSYNLGTINGDHICKFFNAINFGTVLNASLAKSINYGIINFAMFDNLSINSGAILNDATFNRRSNNRGIVYGNGVFTNSSTNTINGSVYETGTFTTNSCNYGYVNIFISDDSCTSGALTDGNLTTSFIGLTDSNYFGSNYQNILYKN